GYPVPNCVRAIQESTHRAHPSGVRDGDRETRGTRARHGREEHGKPELIALAERSRTLAGWKSHGRTRSLQRGGGVPAGRATSRSAGVTRPDGAPILAPVSERTTPASDAR